MRPQGGHFISLFIEELWWFMQHNSYGVWCGCDVAEFLHEKCQTDSAGEFSISHTSLPYFCFKNRKFHLKWNYFLKLFLNSVSWLDKDWEMWNPNINECRCKETGPLVYHWWRGEVVQPLRKTGWWFLKKWQTEFCDSAIPLLGYMQRIERRISKRCLYTHVHREHHSQQPEGRSNPGVYQQLNG